jgi:hypothetical protein
MKRWLLGMAQYTIRYHLPGKAIQLSEAANTRSMTSCRHKRAIDLILEAQAFVDGAVLYPPSSARQGDSTLRGSEPAVHDQLSTHTSEYLI